MLDREFCDGVATGPRQSMIKQDWVVQERFLGIIGYS
jgi:hypothetical protein